MPLRPCWVNIQELRLFPFTKIRLGIEGKCWCATWCSENVLLVLFLPQNPMPGQGGDTVSPLLLLLQVLLLFVDTQPPILRASTKIHSMQIKTNMFHIKWKVNESLIKEKIFKHRQLLHLNWKLESVYLGQMCILGSSNADLIMIPTDQNEGLVG